MATRTVPFASYLTDGSLNTSTTPTVTVQYGGGTASALTVTDAGSAWTVDVDDTQDALLLVTGEGIQSDSLVVLRFPEQLDATLTRLASMATTSGNFADFDPAYSLQNIRQRGDAAWVTGAGVAADLSYAPSSATRVTGDNDGGVLADLASVNGTSFVTGEVTTGDLLDVLLEFDAAEEHTPIPAGLKVWGNYTGNASHFVNVYAREYPGESWEQIGTMSDSSIPAVYTFDLAPQHINPLTGAAGVRFRHGATSGNANHSLILDKVEYTAVSTNTIVHANVIQVNDVAVSSPDDFKADVTSALATYDAATATDVAAIPSAVDVELTASHGSGTWGAAVPSEWVAINETTLDNEGAAIGPMDAADVLLYAISSLGVTVDIGRSEGDGGFVLNVPPSDTYTIRAYRVGYSYPDRQVTV